PCASLGAGQSPCPTGGFQGGFGPTLGGASGRGKMGPPAKPSGAGSLGRGGAVERVSFRPYGAETRDMTSPSTHWESSCKVRGERMRRYPGMKKRQRRGT